MFKSNFELEPEEIFALETGIERTLGRFGRVRLTIFRDEIDNMIESGPAPDGGMWMENKPDKRIIQGIERGYQRYQEIYPGDSVIVFLIPGKRIREKRWCSDQDTVETPI